MKRFLCLLLSLFLVAPLLGACAVSTHLSRSDLAKLRGKTFVITGASSGFGRGVAVRLGAEGANVVLAARRAELLEEVAGQVRAGGGAALVVPTDVSDAAQVEALASAAERRFGRIDVWMNIAGVGAIGKFWNIPVEDYSKLVDTNLKGVIYGSHAALRRFTAQGYGTLVNMGSIDGQVPLAYQSTYSASKAGVLALGRGINEELRHAGFNRRIRVATVMPWAADTPWWPHAANYSGRAPRMAAMDDPAKVVRALVWVALHPREELPVGWKAQASSTMHQLLPDLTESISGNIQRAELEKASPAPATPGSVHRPMQEGRTVDGGVRARMKAEDAAKKNAPRDN